MNEHKPLADVLEPRRPTPHIRVTASYSMGLALLMALARAPRFYLGFMLGGIGHALAHLLEYLGV